jgi:hypothetical protein
MSFVSRFASVVSVSAVALVVGCSSNDASSPSKPGCVCSVTDNGTSQDVACGSEACVGGTTYACSTTASVSKGGACTAPPQSDGGTGEGGTEGPLNCASYAWCGSGNVTQWNGMKLPTARGGVIPDGLYREAYRLAERGTGTQFGDYGSAYLFRKGTFRSLGSLGSAGTFTTDATKLTLQKTSNCNDDTGAETSPGTSSFASEYLVDGTGQLVIFGTSSGSAGSQTIATVYRKVDALCKGLPTAVPAAPGDSYVCKVTNCGCTEASPGPASASVCKFVHGG